MELTLHAPAKVNLTLIVGARRDDGYHDVSTVMQTVGLYDTLTLTEGGSGLTMTCTDPDLPTDGSNLVLRAAAQELAAQGSGYSVSVALEDTEFPCKTYDGFALPAGEYLALRVVIGAGEGRNWWCVVYPPLCTAAACELEGVALDGGMTADDLSLMTGENAGYVLRFRSLELWERLRQWLGK